MIDFRFSVGSTYTYLYVMRLAEVEQSRGVVVSSVMGRLASSPLSDHRAAEFMLLSVVGKGAT